MGPSPPSILTQRGLKLLDLRENLLVPLLFAAYVKLLLSLILLSEQAQRWFHNQCAVEYELLVNTLVLNSMQRCKNYKKLNHILWPIIHKVIVSISPSKLKLKPHIWYCLIYCEHYFAWVRWSNRHV